MIHNKTPLVCSYTRSDSGTRYRYSKAKKNRFLPKYVRLWVVLWPETSLFNRTFTSKHGGGPYRRSRPGWKEPVLGHFLNCNSVCTFCPVFLLIHDLELNPGPPREKTNRKVNVTIALFNVRSMASREKFYLVKQTIVHDNYDMFVISESWLDPSTTNNDI